MGVADKGLRSSADGFSVGKARFSHLQTPFLGSFLHGTFQVRVSFKDPIRRTTQLPSIRCENKKKKDEEPPFIEVSVEKPPYYSYMDSTSGQYEPALGARASIPGKEYWPEGTLDRVRAAKAPEPKGKSKGSPSYGKNPGSRRKKYKTSAAESSTVNVESNEPLECEVVEETMEDPKDLSSEYVVYQTEPEHEEETGYDLDKKIGRPHPFIDPEKKKPIEGTLTSEELWWNWRKPEKEQWSRWQRRRPDVETVFLKAMAETGQVKLHGDTPTLTETSLYRARKHLYKEERLKAEQDRLEEIGPMAYYSEWVKSWKGDTSREAIQKHFEETGEDENTQLQEMLSHQTDREYRIMMGTDIRIRRDPLAMRMREDLIKQIWGGDPVYPTINYIQDPNEVIDYRGPDFHEPTANMLDFLKEHGKLISREDLDKMLAKEKTETVEMTDMDEAMARAVDIGETENEEEDSETEAEGDSEEEEKIPRNWSVYKTTPKPPKSKRKSKKEEKLSLEDAIDDSENLTDFLMDFDEEQ
ncbi:protein PLASTID TRANSCRIPTIONALLY ACTIVE 12, chloroplastic-like [Rutidosis leptorrhynchoides]|uniref:protein PLASTID TRANSCRIPTIONALLY ACTIVE 12, chloroplastic-like n=1 Tax=Rutidosis leptorrhynchoides TaxID=125765 RepID=UPI003A9A0819